MINRLTNLRPSVLSDKWQFNTCQDWELLGDDFDSVSSETILDAILRALGFYYSPLGYLEEGAPWFVYVTDEPELAIQELEDKSQPITDSEDEKARKVSKRTAKRKTRRDIFRAPVRKAFAAGSAGPLSSRPGLPRSPTPLPSCPLVSALSSCLPVLALSSCPPMPALSSCPPMSALSSPPVPAPLFLPVPAPSSPLLLTPSSLPMPAPSSSPMPASLSRFVFGPTPTYLTSSALRTFKRALSD